MKQPPRCDTHRASRKRSYRQLKTPTSPYQSARFCRSGLSDRDETTTTVQYPSRIKKALLQAAKIPRQPPANLHVSVGAVSRTAMKQPPRCDTHRASRKRSYRQLKYPTGLYQSARFCRSGLSDRDETTTTVRYPSRFKKALLQTA
ncbi:MAG: hypothetical protein ABW148_17505, partial [Sedimenticola sp.]